MKATPTTSTFGTICHAGIDWSWQHHALCIVDDDGQRIEEATVSHSRSGLAKITAVLRRQGVDRVGIERGDGPVVEHLSRGVSDPLCKGVTSNLNRRSGSKWRKRHGRSAGHCRGGTTPTRA